MKLLSEDHVVVVLKINHPFFCALMVDKFQRTRADIKKIVESKRINWSSFSLPITNDTTEILEDSTGNIAPCIYVFVPWDYA